jgi:hypothetical protein
MYLALNKADLFNCVVTQKAVIGSRGVPASDGAVETHQKLSRNIRISAETSRRQPRSRSTGSTYRPPQDRCSSTTLFSSQSQLSDKKHTACTLSDSQSKSKSDECEDFNSFSSLKDEGGNESEMASLQEMPEVQHSDILVLKNPIPSDTNVRHMTVYHFVKNSHLHVNDAQDVICENERGQNSMETSKISHYSVEIQGKGQVTAGLGDHDSPENNILQDLLHKQLTIVS